VAALYVYMLYATSASVRQANLARDVVRAEGANQSQAESLSELAASTATSRARLLSFFVPADDVVAFIKALESIGPQSGSSVSMDTIDADPLSDAPPGTTGSIRAHMSAHGSWSSVMRALSIAERMQYSVSIDHVRVDSSSLDTAARRTWDLSFDIKAAMIAVAPSHP
jgi:hypothetical protein